MVIENAERFGLAQLHQLRGRVGRGGEQGHCLLFSNSQSLKSQSRLDYFVQEKNGEKLAEYDMQNRGPGELYGQAQSGFFNLKVGNIWDKTMLEETYQAARQAL
jgi:ATP-dependent DNA helicase RecG